MPQKANYQSYTSKPVRSRLINSFPAPIGEDAIIATFKSSLLYKAFQVFVTVTSGIGTAYLLTELIK